MTNKTKQRTSPVRVNTSTAKRSELHAARLATFEDQK
jgi:hypothetical protein